jgi:hypothetical protein
MEIAFPKPIESKNYLGEVDADWFGWEIIQAGSALP